MSDIETLSAEDQAYFDTRGEATVSPPTSEPETVKDEPVDEPVVDEDVIDAVDEPATDEPADPDKPTGQSKVPLAALTKERNERKAVAAKLAETERRAAILEDRWNQILTQQSQPAQPEAQKPVELDTSSDPLAVVNELLSDFQQRKKTAAEQEQQTKEQQAANEAWNKTLGVAKAQYDAAASADESFEPTYTALRENLGQEYVDLYGLSAAEARAEVDRFEAQQIAYAVDRGIDIAAHMRKLAKARNVSAPVKTPAAKVEDIDKIAEGLNGATSLSTAGGGRVAATNAQSIADMSPEDFSVWLGKPGNGDKFRKLAGG